MTPSIWGLCSLPTSPRQAETKEPRQRLPRTGQWDLCYSPWEKCASSPEESSVARTGRQSHSVATGGIARPLLLPPWDPQAFTRTLVSRHPFFSFQASGQMAHQWPLPTWSHLKPLLHKVDDGVTAHNTTHREDVPSPLSCKVTSGCGCYAVPSISNMHLYWPDHSLTKLWHLLPLPDGCGETSTWQKGIGWVQQLWVPWECLPPAHEAHSCLWSCLGLILDMFPS